ncbi:uncharacterized protein F4822DRAFT_319195 [Hypoxylon trugodes]|uniref:uncharacterized protein n=1 Tax=Hypoxylon trugodes TaxID=326681 RepID=UPI00219B80D1|nr:uncharacterized protein F4822DRAFT_319195 [Hypoxylon trugodes]KAI1386515.1 hypothetical protein F4822DRAFT_319195 [Hypoxylon trugodes]
MASMAHFQGRLYCMPHHRLTCWECLHSINAGISGHIPNPETQSGIRCKQSAFIVEPKFEMFHNTSAILGFHCGLSPEDQVKLADHMLPQFHTEFNNQPCEDCRLCYFSPGGQLTTHPSHICTNMERYVQVAIRPYKFSRTSNQIECSATFFFGEFYPASPMTASYVSKSKPDECSMDWNLDNAEIASVVECLRHVEKKLVPYRKSLVKDYLYTNSEYFAGKSWRFQLVVYTQLNEHVLKTLLEAHKLKFSKSRKAYIDRNTIGLAKKVFPASEERRYRISSFIYRINKLALLGIQVFFVHTERDPDHIKARRSFWEQPKGQVFPQAAFNESEYNDDQGQYDEELREDDLLDGDDLRDPTGHAGFESVETSTHHQSGGNIFDSP